MSNATRRSFLKTSLVTPDRLAPAGGPAASLATSASRRAFLQTSAVVAAGAAIAGPGPKLAAAAFSGVASTNPLGAVTKPSGPPPAETVMAYIRDAERGEITVTSGTRETTYLDPALTRRLLDAAR